ncbi:hypothetical protein DFQ27_006386 [Actinomortierella ambigua]|uniref:Uncharacterized protein n=1 Tax=Actinomortierella ambigua TaxID=1343610 RepID=A0A9P6PZ61_9FUNG|nr:hypothetical protein DFQ27_006386 [Actinomortierella ambigua]
MSPGQVAVVDQACDLAAEADPEELVCPRPGKQTYKLYTMCDSFLGCDQELDMAVDVGEGAESDDEEEDENEDQYVFKVPHFLGAIPLITVLYDNVQSKSALKL